MNQSGACPECGQMVVAVEISREPRETTYDKTSWELTGYRTFEPGPFADVTLSCGHEIHGIDGVRWLEGHAT